MPKLKMGSKVYAKKIKREVLQEVAIPVVSASFRNTFKRPLSNLSRLFIFTLVVKGLKISFQLILNCHYVFYASSKHLKSPEVV